jgi:4-amino-4-deoxy-L-arabinose transferase-like glycosyltransferase
LPRSALWLLCLAYGLPGLFGRDPWRNADLAAFGQMVAMAEGRTSWWSPTLGSVGGDAALLPHWLGAAFVWLLTPVTGAELAARVPFALLLAATMSFVWYGTLHLARTEAAQPVPFAFGGEADPVDYARAMADAALLALIATLGLLQLGHETTPELAQLCTVALLTYGIAAAPYRPWHARAAVLAALPLLAGSGAPGVALAIAAGGMMACGGSRLPAVRPLVWWLGFAAALAAALGALLGTWRWRAEVQDASAVSGIARQWAWFMWPAWPLALWTLWRWRRQLSHRHISVPAIGVVVALGANLALSGNDRALLLGLPGLAMLAAFALPTMRRSATAAIDWFSMLFFTLAALWIWVMYIAMQTGWPAKPAANVAKLAPGFEATFSALAVALAGAGSVAWVWLVRWRTGRHREAIWKSLVLPAGGVALCWLLAMTLWLPVLDYARSPRAWVERVAAHVPLESCIAAPGLPAAGAAALEHFGRWRVDVRPQSTQAGCDVLLVVTRALPAPASPKGWRLAAEVTRPTERAERTLIYRRGG